MVIMDESRNQGLDIVLNPFFPSFYSSVTFRLRIPKVQKRNHSIIWLTENYDDTTLYSGLDAKIYISMSLDFRSPEIELSDVSG